MWPGVRAGVRFLDDMLELVARHGALDLEVVTRGDLDVDQYHKVEDVGLALGEAKRIALGSKRGILRAGYLRRARDTVLGHCLGLQALFASSKEDPAKRV